MNRYSAKNCKKEYKIMSKTKVVTGKKIEALPKKEREGGMFGFAPKTREAVNSFKKNDEQPKAGSISLMDVPLSIIKDRPVNRFIISDIEELAKSIEEVGLQQSVVLKQNIDEDDNITYTVCIGHRRLAAYRLLDKKYKDGRYRYISAKVLTPSEELNEERAYLESNSQIRKLTLFEAIATVNPEEMNFDNESFKTKYLEYMRKKDEYVENKDKFNQESIQRYIAYLIEDIYPSLEINTGSLKRYIILCCKAIDDLKEKIFSGEIPLRWAVLYSGCNKEEQERIINSADYQKEYELIVNEKKTRKGETKARTSNKVDLKEIEKRISKFAEVILKQCNEASKIVPSRENKKDLKAIETLSKAINTYRTNIK